MQRISFPNCFHMQVFWVKCLGHSQESWFKSWGLSAGLIYFIGDCNYPVLKFPVIIFVSRAFAVWMLRVVSLKFQLTDILLPYKNDCAFVLKFPLLRPIMPFSFSTLIQHLQQLFLTALQRQSLAHTLTTSPHNKSLSLQYFYPYCLNDTDHWFIQLYVFQFCVMLIYFNGKKTWILLNENFIL